MSNTGSLYIVVAPSGAGKTTLVRALIASVANISVSISYTTRSMRPGDRDGVDYHFVDEAKFSSMIEAGDFLEHAVVFGNHYGTSRVWVEQQLASGVDIILEIDWQGAQRIKEMFPASVGIYILPPSLAALRSRLIGRAQDDEQVIEKRLSQAMADMSHYDEQDFLLINEDVEEALANFQHIVYAHRLRQPVMAAKCVELLAELTQKQ